MKALVLKELYSLSRTARTLVLTMAFVGLALIPENGPEGFAAMAPVMCGMLIISTFSIDESCHWDRTALTMPLSRPLVMGAKYVKLMLLALAGMAVGLIGSVIGAAATSALTAKTLITAGLSAVAGVALTLTAMGATIPLVVRFGAERGRILMFLSMLIPAGAIALLAALGGSMPDEMIFVLIPAAVIAALLWNLLMWRISCTLYAKKDL